MMQDAHIHLHDAIEEGDKILACAGARGVGRFFCNSAGPSDWSDVKELSDRHAEVVPFFGVHPWHSGDVRGGWEDELKRYLSASRGGIGEIGLDMARKGLDPDRQRAVFSRQLDIAVELNKPFTVHCVQAWDVLFEDIRQRAGDNLVFMVHWFSGSVETAMELVKLGGYISFSPRLLYERAKKHRASFDACPAERILLETDYPYMPDTFGSAAPGAEKYFEWLDSVYAFASRQKGMDRPDFTGKVWDNGTVFLHRTALGQR